SIVLPLSQASHPPSWTTYSGNPDVLYPWLLVRGSPDIVYPHGAGTLDATVSVPADGRYGIWVKGAFQRGLEVRLDGRKVGEPNYQLNDVGVYTPMGAVKLQA